MNSSNRRSFMLQVVATGSALATASVYAQHTGPKLEESDPQATALGYKHDTTKVNSKKYPKHTVSQDCATCQLFQGKPKDATGACPLFPGKQVAANGWCSAWVKKVG
jgi:hypothetical protein